MRSAADPLALLDSIGREPWSWDFFQALRRIECAHPRQPRLGTATRPSEEAIRLGQEPSLSFAPASLSGLAPAYGRRPPRIEVRFLGMLGPNGPLPLHLTEHARNRLLHAGDATFARFLDIFHHRYLTLVYRAWAQAQPTVSLDRPHEDRYGMHLGALAGLGMPSLRGRDALPDAAKLHHAGLFNRQVRNAEGLGKFIGNHFGCLVDVQQFVGHWMPLRQRDRLALGGGMHRLGRSALLGRKVWDRQHKFRLRLGPLPRADYEALLPGGRALPALAASVHNYAGLEYAWDAQLVLRAGERPPARLNRSVRLGYTSWLGRRACTADADNLILDVERVLRRPPRDAAAAGDTAAFNPAPARPV